MLKIDILNNKEVKKLNEILDWLIKFSNFCEIDGEILDKFLKENPIPDDRLTCKFNCIDCD